MSIRVLLVLISAVMIIGCDDKLNSIAENYFAVSDTSLELPDITVSKSELTYNRDISLWTLNDKPYSGYVVSHYQHGTPKERFGVLNGKQQNQATFWFADGHYKRVENYNQGKLHGPKKSWSQDSVHIVISHLNYVSGKLHGEQTKWYPTGEVFKKMNLNMGREDGIQQAFSQNGDLYANYEARDGKVFGLKKSALCFGIEDEKIQY